MSHVFISYVRENQALVDRLCRELRQQGVICWLDREQIQPGQRWKQAIRQAIERGGFFLACFSAEYFTRDSTYMNEELTLAIEELRKRPTDRAWFIPVLLTSCELPKRDIGGGEQLHDLHWVSLWEDWPAGIQRIVSVIKPDATHSTPPPSPTSELSELRLRAKALHVDLSEQAIFIVQQLVHSGDDKFFYADWGNGQWSLQLSRGEQAQLGVLEPRFIQEDLNELVALQLLTVEFNADGHGIYGITRNAVRFCEALDGKRGA